MMSLIASCSFWAIGKKYEKVRSPCTYCRIKGLYSIWVSMSSRKRNTKLAEVTGSSRPKASGWWWTTPWPDAGCCKGHPWPGNNQPRSWKGQHRASSGTRGLVGLAHEQRTSFTKWSGAGSEFYAGLAVKTKAGTAQTPKLAWQKKSQQLSDLNSA